MDTIDVLTTIDERLVDWLIHASPNNADDAAKMKEIVLYRGRLDQEINRIVLNRLRLATIDVTDQLAKLKQIDQALASAAQKVEAAKAVASFASTAVSVAVSITSLIV